jgi:hypothetical protein
MKVAARRSSSLIDGMVYGENPRLGFFQGRSSCTDLKFQFRFPTAGRPTAADAVTGVSTGQMPRSSSRCAWHRRRGVLKFFAQRGLQGGRCRNHHPTGLPSLSGEFSARSGQTAVRIASFINTAVPPDELPPSRSATSSAVMYRAFPAEPQELRSIDRSTRADGSRCDCAWSGFRGT